MWYWATADRVQSCSGEVRLDVSRVNGMRNPINSPNQVPSTRNLSPRQITTILSIIKTYSNE